MAGTLCWPTRAAVISDGAYGVRGFPGDTTGTGRLAEWYRSHAEAWTRLAAATTTTTTLWFWNTEVGWATAHPLLADQGWEYGRVTTWEPFGGPASASVAAVQAGRLPCVAELDPASPSSRPSGSLTRSTQN